MVTPTKHSLSTHQLSKSKNDVNKRSKQVTSNVDW